MAADSEAQRVIDVANWILSHARQQPRVGLILGSGLAALAAGTDSDAVRVPYTDCPALPAPTVAGHEGVLVAGTMAGVPCVMMQGRYHLYEGHDATTVALPARALIRAGIETLIVTNAAGGLNRTFHAGDLMVIEDQINLQGANPLIGRVLPGETRFPDMSAPYDPRLIQLAESVARRERIRLQRGVYCGLLGPSYETFAEIRMLQRMGADAVGMSTVAEVLAARSTGTPVLGMSVITNLAAGITAEPLHHEDVIAAGVAAAGRMTALIRGVLAEWPAA